MAVELGLAAAAADVKIGSVPVEGILVGGRRIRNRRRTVVGALTLASVVALGSGTVAGLNGFAGNGPTAQALQAGDGGFLPLVPGAEASADPGAAATKTGARDPLKPVRVMIGHGTADGKQWQLWEALWPLAPKEQAYAQAVAVWEERHAVDPSLEKPTEAYVQQFWQPTEDVVNTYATLDGARQKYDTQGGYPAPGHLDPRMADTFSGGVLGPSAKSGTSGPLPIRLAVLAIGPDVGKVVVDWSDGGVAEPTPVVVEDSPYRMVVVPERPGLKVGSWRFFDKNGVELPNAGTRLLSE
ncbi:hypothetical protein AMK19_29675 [Kitasatospora sp. CB01950]|nr:hypothetical protein AMK19_29675 [Kitasatospora sp. CB01950]